MKIRPYWMLAAYAYKPEDCAALIETANTKGWLDGTYSDGTKRDNVSVCFLEQGDYEVSDGWIESFRMTAGYTRAAIRSACPPGASDVHPNLPLARGRPLRNAQGPRHDRAALE